MIKNCGHPPFARLVASGAELGLLGHLKVELRQLHQRILHRFHASASLNLVASFVKARLMMILTPSDY